MPSEEKDIAVLQTEMKNLVKSVDILATKFDNLTDKIENHYVKVEDFDSLEKRVSTITEKVEGLTLFKAQMIAGGAVLGFLLDYLVRWITKN